VEAALSQAELEYEAALQDLESAEAARAVVEGRFTRWAEEADAARRAGDSDRLEAALAQAQAQSVELRRLDRRVTQAQEVVSEARQTYLGLLDSRLDAILEEARTASAEDRVGLMVLVEDLNNRVEEVEAEAGADDLFGPPVMPEVVFDPRDGPVELRVKADLLERRAQAYDSLLVQVEDRIDTLERRVQRDQSLRQFLEGIDRFGETQLPVRAPDARDPVQTEGQAPSDSISATRQLTPAEEIDQLRFLLDELTTTRDQLRIRARLFRDRAGGSVWA
jgi:hypothetical protein